MNFFMPNIFWIMAVSAMVSVHVAIGVVAAGPIGETITKSGLSVTVRDFVQMPQINKSGSSYARINFLREEPDGADRLFANDLTATSIRSIKHPRQ